MREEIALTIKKKIYDFLVWPPVNIPVGHALRKLPAIYRRLGFDFPARGQLEVRNEGGAVCFKMESDGSDVIASRVYFGGLTGFEPETVNFLKTILNNVQVFIDVGASTGFYSLLAATFSNVQKVYAFEPAPHVFASLVNNIEINGFRQVVPESLVVSNKSGQAFLYIPRSIRMATGISTNMNHRKNTYEVAVDSTTIDQYMEINGIPKVDLVKIDTESSEPKVILGALKTIERWRPKLIVEILSERVYTELMKLLSPLGYRCSHITADGLRQVGAFSESRATMEFNYLFTTTDL